MRIECTRCNAAGRIEEYSHIKNGICFLCSGGKTINVSNLHEVGVKLKVWIADEKWDQPTSWNYKTRIALTVQEKDGSSFSLLTLEYKMGFGASAAKARRLADRVEQSNKGIEYFTQNNPYWERIF